ncbi:hypothetical protein KFL_009150020 [Klebsormidium nitens]|uniref:Reverse transcriptase Ty1/copia-type domain-containing protein n=1 Tax=Klebsormidium nitens TaxID=105231 RepID=A0A1Y1IPU0_KLENI|nr:hypothetical protein KFL_009150020 [Klebsormidium nitens]|eukprot:GAQ92062.1 hypothetical protein KFL_009150020 [Klebsormidium nitens]
MYVPGVAANLISVSKATEIASAFFKENGNWEWCTRRPPPTTAEQNGSAERLNRQLVEKVRAMLEDSGVPKKCAARAVVTANYIRNRTPVSAYGRIPLGGVLLQEAQRRAHAGVWGASLRHVPKKTEVGSEGYCANLAADAEAGKHPRGTREHPEPQSYQKAVGGEESDLWRKSMDEEMRPLLENGTWEIVEKPEGVKPFPMKWVYKIKRDAHDIVERAPRVAHMRLKDELGNFEFVASMADAALFTGIVAGERGYLVVWVDDILVEACGEERFVKVKAHLTEKFDVRDVEKATNFLAMELTPDREARSLKLTQKKLTGELVGRYGLADARARSVALGTGDKLTKEGEPLNTKRFPYSECGKPAVPECLHEARHRTGGGRACALHGRADGGELAGDTWRCALSGGDGGGRGDLVGSDETLVGFYDADYAGDVDTKGSTMGYTFLMYRGAVSWSSRLWPTVAASTVEAEYMSAAQAVKEALWIRNLGEISSWTSERSRSTATTRGQFGY